MLFRSPEEVWRLFAGFTGYAEPFRTVITELGKAPGPNAVSTAGANPEPQHK